MKRAWLGRSAILISSLITAFLSLWVTPGSATAAGGDLDPTFGQDGRVVTRIGDQSYVVAVALQSYGRVIAAGTTRTDGDADFALARYHSDGSLDTTFGTDGVVTTDFGTRHDAVSGVVGQGESNIIVAGAKQRGERRTWIVARYDGSGVLDVGFARNGWATIGFGRALGSDLVASEVSDVGLQSDGKIIVAGSALDLNTYVSYLAIARLNRNGSVDRSFGDDGRVLARSPGGGTVGAMALLPNDRILMGGSSITGGDAFRDFAITRYLPDGEIDPSFEPATTDFGPNDNVNDLALGAGGSFVAAGTGDPLPDQEEGFAIARYRADGSPDPTFSGDGRQFTKVGAGLPPYLYAVAVQTDQRVVAAGYAYLERKPVIALTRYRENGSLDPSFGGDGRIYTTVLDFSVATDVLVQPNGAILAGGGTTGARGDRFALVRYLAS